MPSDIMKVGQFLTQGFISSRPSDQDPVLPSFMLLKQINGENSLDLMCRTNFLRIVVDVNTDECALTPYVDCEESMRASLAQSRKFSLTILHAEPR